MKRVISLMLAFAVIFSMAAVAAPAGELNTALAASLSRAAGYYRASGARPSCWDVAALSSMGISPAREGIKLDGLDFDMFLKKYDDVYEVSSRVITLIALGENPETYDPDINDKSTLSRLASAQRADGGFDLSLWLHAQCTIAAHESGAPYKADKALSFLLKYQNADGGFGMDPGAVSSGDSTSFALLTLCKVFPDREDAVKAAKGAREYLFGLQDASGAFKSYDYAEENSCTTALALTALMASGLTANDSKVSSGLKALMLFSAADGGFKLLKGDVVSNPQFTPFAVIALGDAYFGKPLFERLGSVGADVSVIFRDAARISGWARPYVSSAYENGLMMGDKTGDFRPKANVLRGEAASILSRLSGGAKDASNVYAEDLFATAWYYRDFCAAVERGLLLSLDGKFRPEQYLTREEAAFAIAKLLKLPEASAMPPDIESATEDLKPSICSVVASGIMVGDETGSFRPLALITREEAAKVFLLASQYQKTVEASAANKR